MNIQGQPSSISKMILAIFAFLFIVFSTFINATSSADARSVRLPPSPNRPIIFFDLGNVLIDTSDWDNLRYMPEAEDYLRKLYQGHFAIGLITNVPEEWGKTDPEKLERLKQEIEKTWKEAKPFPWQIFSYVVFPPSDKLRKPHPRMFEIAMAYAKKCRPVYEGEDSKEVDVANDVGFYSYMTNQSSQPTFLPIEDMRCQKRRN